MQRKCNVTKIQTNNIGLETKLKYIDYFFKKFYLVFHIFANNIGI
jgi:hypothetical protein